MAVKPSTGVLGRSTALGGLWGRSGSSGHRRDLCVRVNEWSVS